MAQITINGKSCQFEGKPMILQVAEDNGIELPHYCYHPGLSIVASCRICLAEIEAPNPRDDNKLAFIPKLMPTCQTPAADGMNVYTNTPKASANQKQVMENLLINHPLDCPVCDQAGECKLQDYSYNYGRSESRFEEAKIKQPVKDIGPHVKLYSDRCIMCTRCVRFTQEITDTHELAIFGRGSSEQIDVFPGFPLDNDLSGNVVDLCPVGALLDKDFLFTQRVWFLDKTASIDGLTASGDNLWIEHNKGKIYRFKPRENQDVNGWWITDEVRYGWKFIHREDRLTSPIKLQFGEQIAISWDKAMKAVCHGVNEAEGRLALMVSPMLSTEEAYLLGKWARAMDAQAILAVGPIPMRGENKSFANGYTLCAEKCPNSRGVRKALQSLGSEPVLDFQAFTDLLADKKSGIGSVMLTGNYPDTWTSKELVKAIGKRFMALIDTLPNELTSKAQVLLPGATWTEKQGSFENHQGRIQAFQQAIPVLEGARPEGQIALDLLASHLGQDQAERFDAQAVREEMGDNFKAHPCPQYAHPVESELQFVEL